MVEKLELPPMLPDHEVRRLAAEGWRKELAALEVLERKLAAGRVEDEAVKAQAARRAKSLGAGQVGFGF